MQGYINAIQKAKVSRTCKNCLYYGSNGYHCGNANNQGKPMFYVNYGNACEHFWLDQNRFPNAESRR